MIYYMFEKMNGLELFEKIKRASTFIALVNEELTASKRGNVFEKVIDLIIKFGFCPNFPNNEYAHYEGNVNTCRLYEVKNLENYLKKLKVYSKGKGGSSDITLRNKITGKWIVISCKYHGDDSKKSIKKYDVEYIFTAVKNNSHFYKDFAIYLAVHDKKAVEKVKNYL